MAENGDMKDDVKQPSGEVGDKIQQLFSSEKDTSKPPLPFSAREKELAYALRLSTGLWYASM
jgi:hypothetical protein